jgi:hypothetical protein
MHEKDPREYLEYEPDTGDFRWKKQPNWRGPYIVGQIAGGVNAQHYWQIRLGKRNYYGHRLAWLFVHGHMPDNIDHINEKPYDNRICNLRECTHARNIAAIYKEAKGYEIHGAKYRARIEVDGIRHELGSFNTPKEATAAYQAARDNLLGEFA